LPIGTSPRTLERSSSPPPPETIGGSDSTRRDHT
jgi:hypothetical protein